MLINPKLRLPASSQNSNCVYSEKQTSTDDRDSGASCHEIHFLYIPQNMCCKVPAASTSATRRSRRTYLPAPHPHSHHVNNSLTVVCVCLLHFTASRETSRSQRGMGLSRQHHRLTLQGQAGFLLHFPCLQFTCSPPVTWASSYMLKAHTSISAFPELCARLCHMVDWHPDQCLALSCTQCSPWGITLLGTSAW